MIRYMNGVVYVDDEAPGAMPNGTRIVKLRIYDAVEAHPIGTPGTVLGSIPLPEEVTKELADRGVPDARFSYFVEWDPLPGYPVAVVGPKIGRMQ